MKILVVSAHPDDETLGCSGTILKHVSQGDEVFWLLATAPIGSRWPDGLFQREKAILQCVVQSYGISRLFELDFPSTELANVSENQLIDTIGDVVAQVRPHIVYLVHRGDVHSDHRILFDTFWVVAKPFNDHGIRRILTYECLSSTDAAPPFIERAFIPNVYSDITDFFEQKLRIMQLYETEIHPEPLPRSLSAIEALARYRGATIGVKYAEAFMLLREVF